ncbi:MAG: hypothetical protein VCD33_08220, partial [Alphaproteobacteria bacterium]
MGFRIADDHEAVERLEIVRDVDGTAEKQQQETADNPVPPPACPRQSGSAHEDEVQDDAEQNEGADTFEQNIGHWR